MNHEPFWPSFKKDLDRQLAYATTRGAKQYARLALVDGVWALAVYRFGRALKARRANGPLWAAFRAAEVAVRAVTGIALSVDARIAPGFYIGHHGAITVGPGAEIGANSSIGQLCYVGAAGPDGKSGAPKLGERVYLGVGAKVLGGVAVGDGAAVGANAVVLDDVPPSGVAAGVPARTVSLKGSADFIYLGQGRKPVSAEEVEAGSKAS